MPGRARVRLRRSRARRPLGLLSCPLQEGVTSSHLLLLCRELLAGSEEPARHVEPCAHERRSHPAEQCAPEQTPNAALRFAVLGTVERSAPCENADRVMAVRQRRLAAER